MEEFEIFDLRITVESIGGRSVCGLKVGDYFEVRQSSKLYLPEGQHFCIFALSAVIPLLPAKMRQMDKNDWLEKDVLVACPDPEEKLVMRIKRLDKRTMDSTELT